MASTGNYELIFAGGGPILRFPTLLDALTEFTNSAISSAVLKDYKGKSAYLLKLTKHATDVERLKWV